MIYDCERRENMDGVILIAFFIHGAVFATFNWVVAKEKNRDLTGWTLAGFYFGIIALIALSGLSTLKKRKPAKAEGVEQKDEPGEYRELGVTD